MDNPLISIIIPIYNVPSYYMDKSIESVTKQEYKNIEIILVDDGSEEKTASKCDDYAKTDSRIKVIHQTNSGVSKARNNGIEQCSGEYVMFVDADDIISPNAVSIAFSIAKQYSADIVIGATLKIQSLDEFDWNTKSKRVLVLNDERKKDQLRLPYFSTQSKELSEFCEKGYISRAPFARLIRLEIVKSTPFPEGYPLGEDAIWNMRLLEKSRVICISNRVWYGYNIHSGSAIRKYYGNRIELAEKYLNTINNDNLSFCKQYPNAAGLNTVIEYYCVLRYDLLSEKCKLDTKEKNRIAKDLIQKKPWSIMFEKKVFFHLPIKYRLLLVFVKTNMWISYLKLSKAISGKSE